MNILVTGACGFVGKNLVAAIRNIRDGKERTHPELDIREIFEYDTDGSPEQLTAYAESADFVFHLAGVNRPKTAEEYLPGNTGSLELLLAALQNAGNRCPVMLASSAQASLVWRYAGSEYGKAKLACEKLLRTYAAETGAEALIYRFPNVFGKWCRPNYNSVVATFCHNIARGLPITVNDPATELELVYIDDVVNELIAALEHLEDQVQVVAAVGFVQIFHVLQHRGGDALKAGRTVGLQDLALDVVAQGLLGGQQVAHALQCLCFHKMVPLYINQCKYFYLIHYKEICRFVN